MIDEQAQSLSEYRLNKAKDLLIQSELLLTYQRYDGSINRSYYAIFNAVRARLALVGIDNRSHQGVISYFDRYFVKPGVFERQFSKIIHTAFDSRQDNDYEDFYNPSESDARDQFSNAILFIKEIGCKLEEFKKEKLPLPILE
jgi:uncharacterized protein (UPF0332 family)